MRSDVSQKRRFDVSATFRARRLVAETSLLRLCVRRSSQDAFALAKKRHFDACATDRGHPRHFDPPQKRRFGVCAANGARFTALASSHKRRFNVYAPKQASKVLPPRRTNVTLTSVRRFGHIPPSQKRHFDVSAAKRRRTNGNLVHRRDTLTFLRPHKRRFDVSATFSRRTNEKLTSLRRFLTHKRRSVAGAAAFRRLCDGKSQQIDLDIARKQHFCFQQQLVIACLVVEDLVETVTSAEPSLATSSWIDANCRKASG